MKESANAYFDSCRPSFYAISGIINTSYILAEYVSSVRDVVPGWFNHIGNTSVASQVTAISVFALANRAHKRLPHANERIVEAVSVAGGALTGLAVTALLEAPSLAETLNKVSDPKDFAFGVAGVVLGACGISFDKMRQNSRQSAEGA